MGRDLDDVDRGILFLLQQDARNRTAQEIGEEVGVSASTVRNRIERMEDDGIIRGYHLDVGYEAANLPLQLTFVISVDPNELTGTSDALQEVEGVVDVREMLTGRRNLHADVVGRVRAT